MVRITFGGPELEGLVVEHPAASVRLLLPSSGATDIVIPTWRGNEFLLPDGSRPAIRTFTPRRVDPAEQELDLDVVIHDGGVASDWAQRAAVGDRVAVSGPGRGYAFDAEARRFLLAGDETAIPAISQLLEILPAGTPVEVHLEIAHPDARLRLPDHPGATVEWHDLGEEEAPGLTLLRAVKNVDVSSGSRIWVAGEAAGVQRIRKHLFQERGTPRAQATIRGYWKIGRGGGDGD